MIDDLINHGTSEPYRMFTSRSEYRLSLRADNADLRLTAKGIAINCVSTIRKLAFEKKLEALKVLRETLHQLSITPNQAKGFAIDLNHDGVRRTAFELLTYPHIKFSDVCRVWDDLQNTPLEIVEQIEIEAMYSGYLERQQQDIEAFKRDDGLLIPDSLNYENLPSLSTEIKNKLIYHKPPTIGAASNIQGMTPAALMVLISNIRKQSNFDK
jgi:tRNA uridine 5-carboxymethylaminomethyl modification enzyme